MVPIDRFGHRPIVVPVVAVGGAGVVGGRVPQQLVDRDRQTHRALFAGLEDVRGRTYQILVRKK